MIHKKKLEIIACILLVAVCLLVIWEMYLPKSFNKNTVMYEAQKGMGDEEIANDLKDRGLIKSALFFDAYLILSNQHAKLQAGKYELSASMSAYEIAQKLIAGDVIKNTITVIEGWDSRDIADYLESKQVYDKKEFLDLVSSTTFNESFSFLTDKPKSLSLEGYLFPDTYFMPLETKPEAFIKTMLANFDRKLTDDLREEIKSQKKSIFEIVTMASILEKEVILTEDKKMVSGILWKRIDVGMPLQADSTVNYITGKTDARISRDDTKIKSLYNTYANLGLPLGPISNPGLDSIMAAIYPTKSAYWYYLSANETGETIFSKTLDEHNEAVAKYLK